MPAETEITELEFFEPDRVDGVKSAANGFPILMLKSLGADDEDVAKADDAKCDCCGGDGKMDDGSKCDKCRGTGMMPKVGMSEKELEAAAKAGVAPSGAPTEPADKCPTCKGTGQIGPVATDQSECPDCDGSGKDSSMPPADKLSRVDAEGHKIHVGDAKGREKVDKGLCEDTECDVCKEVADDDLEKKKLDAEARNALPDSAFALPGRRYPIHDENHARNALARVAQNGTPEEQAKVKAAVHRKFPNIGEGDDAEKSFISPNAQLAAMATKVGDDSPGDDDVNTPGSPAWEGVDAQIATDAATALMAAAELIRQFAGREGQEVAAGEGNDLYDVFDAGQALCAVNDALGVMARMAFHEGLEAAKSLSDDEVIEKAGKRLSTKSVSALAAARDHITQLLGDDDPAQNDDDGNSADANKSQKDILDMTEDDLQKLVATTVAQAVVAAKSAENEAEKGKSAMDEAEAVSNAKDANNKAKAKDPKAEDKDLEDEKEQGTNDSASSPAMGAAKSEGDDDEVTKELTPAEVEANEVADRLRKELADAEAHQKEVADNAALSAKIEEHLAKVVEQNEVLKSTVEDLKTELEGVKKMAAPTSIARMAPSDAQNVAKARDAVELRIAALDREARETSDPTVREGNREMIKELRSELSNKN